MRKSRRQEGSKASRRMSSSPSKSPARCSVRRSLIVQPLEQRQLLAGDVGDLQPDNVSADVGGPMAPASDSLALASRNERARDRDGPRDRTPRRDDTTPPEIRSIDGTGNNLDNPELGSTHTPLRRLVESDYADGIHEPAGEDRASPREISNIIFAQDESVLNDRGLSDLAWQWGQFLDHDIDLTEEDDDASFDIPVPAGDPFFDPEGTGEQVISLTRSGIADGTGIESPAEQVNAITAFIDGSQIYGSDEVTAAALRSPEGGGRLLTSEGDLLPIGEDGFFQAGDVRANEQHGLTAMHTLWVREHNSVADEIAAENPRLSDEEIYQRARAIVIAELQAITFNEYLPSLLGRDAIPTYQGYNAEVDPGISNLFATAAFRYGHTSLSSELQRLDDDGNVIPEGNILLRDAFFNTDDVIELGIDPLLKGLASNVSQEIDTLVIDDVRNFLFGPPGSGGFDLVSLNIQRGRDHGLPDYNSAREQLGLERAESFADITSDLDLQARLEQAYGTVDDIDVWVGALAEDHVVGASVGELTRAVLVEQFTALRDGDRLWYQNTFSGRQLRQIESTRLSDVIERNTGLTSIQNNAFFAPEEGGRDRSRDNRDGSNRGSGEPEGGRNPDPDFRSIGRSNLRDGETDREDHEDDRPPAPRPTREMGRAADSISEDDPAVTPPTADANDLAEERENRQQNQRGGTGLDPLAVDQLIRRMR